VAADANSHYTHRAAAVEEACRRVERVLRLLVRLHRQNTSAVVGRATFLNRRKADRSHSSRAVAVAADDDSRNNVVLVDDHVADEATDRLAPLHLQVLLLLVVDSRAGLVVPWGSKDCGWAFHPYLTATAASLLALVPARGVDKAAAAAVACSRNAADCPHGRRRPSRTTKARRRIAVADTWPPELASP
jgi:hypothetical protein